MAEIEIRQATTHNLKGVDLRFATHQLIGFSGLSGSGKSSLAFDTLCREGLRRCVRAILPHAGHLVDRIEKPPCLAIEGLPPTIAIEQKTANRSPRSTLATLCHTYDLLRLLYGHGAHPHSPTTGDSLRPLAPADIAQALRAYTTTVLIAAPLFEQKKGAIAPLLQVWHERGFSRCILNGTLHRLDTLPPLSPEHPHTAALVIDRIDPQKVSEKRCLEAIHLALEHGGQQLLVITDAAETLFSTYSYCPVEKQSYPKLTPHHFSFNHPHGMCPVCHGLGWATTIDLTKAIDPKKSIAEGACPFAPSYTTIRHKNIYDNLARLFHFSVETPWESLSAEAQEVFLYGASKRWLSMTFTHPITKTTWKERVLWKGVEHDALERYHTYTSKAAREKMRVWMHEGVCQSCHGGRLAPYPAAAKLEGWTLPYLLDQPIEAVVDWLEKGTFPTTLTPVVTALQHRLHCLITIGLGYLSLGRPSATLSGGEAQRARLASCLGLQLNGALYILDEPSIGLHPQDTYRLVGALQTLRDQGSTVVVVEHDAATLCACDTLVEFGPGAGQAGGEIVQIGPTQQFLTQPSLTADYLTGRRTITGKVHRRPPTHHITLKDVSFRTLKIDTFSLPLNRFVGLAGVSGSGKSTLVHSVLRPHLENRTLQHRLPPALGTIEGLEGIEQFAMIDQTPIGRLPRSTPATYVKAFDAIRSFWAELPMSRAKGFTASRYSFNTAQGACPTCQGMGWVNLKLENMADDYVRCPLCQGQRYDATTLAVRHKGCSIADVLAMTVDQARDFFAHQGKIMRLLQPLADVGLGYLCLGQPATQLSGGEAQRIKLARGLAHDQCKGMLYILDEPTTGLHPHNVQDLINTLQKLVEAGASILVIEHHLEMLAQTDWLIELGPVGGPDGGYCIAHGPTEQVLQGATPTARAFQPTPPSSTPPPAPTTVDRWKLTGVSTRHLKAIDVEGPSKGLTVITGPSGSGKTSLALHTIAAEGVRRYADTLPPYWRQSVRQQAAPSMATASGLAPTITFSEYYDSVNPRSTVATLSHIYDYLRYLWASHGVPHSPQTQQPLIAVTPHYLCQWLATHPPGTKVHLFAPITPHDGNWSDCALHLFHRGFHRVFFQEQWWELTDTTPEQWTPFNGEEHTALVLIDRFKIDPKKPSDRFLLSLEQALSVNPSRLVLQIENTNHTFEMGYYCPTTNTTYPPLRPKHFAFNAPEGWCPHCKGLGKIEAPDTTALLQTCTLTPRQWLAQLALSHLLPKKGGDTPIAQLATAPWLTDGDGNWPGLTATLLLARSSARIQLQMTHQLPTTTQCCPFCHGGRLAPYGAHATLFGTTLPTLCQGTVEEAYTFFQTHTDPSWSQGIQQTHQEVLARLRFLCRVGLHSLQLHQSAPSLSRSQRQRIRLAMAIGGAMTGALYVLDDPFNGLAEEEVHQLITTLKSLCQKGNGVIVADRHPALYQAADHLIALGPAGGVDGGEIIYQGPPQHYLAQPAIQQLLQPPKPVHAANGVGGFNVTVQERTLFWPKKTLGALCGPSGCGKSYALRQIYQQCHDKNTFFKVTLLEGTKTHITSFSDIASYCGLSPLLREIWAATPTAKALGLKPGHFSPNTKVGQCEKCQGRGYTVVDLQLLPPTKTPCTACDGQRLNPISRTITFKGTTLPTLLQRPIKNLTTLFATRPAIQAKIDALLQLQLGHCALGQPTASLASGEQQRLKLMPLLQTQPGHLWLIDDPCVGLRLDDATQLGQVFRTCVAQGASIVVAAHDPHFLAQCDWRHTLIM